jgi:hypothetical protein
MNSKRILIISDLPVWPPNAGNKTRVWTLMNNLRALGHEVSFLGLGLREDEADALSDRWGAGVYNFPKVRARDARPRWFALKRFLTDRFIARGIGAPGVDHWYWPHWDVLLKKFAQEHTFDVVVAEYVFYTRALLAFGPEVLKVVDTHDVYTGRREKLKARNIRRFYQYLTRAEEEVRGLERADVVMSIQDHESRVFREMLENSRPVVTVGHTVAPQPLPLPANANMLFVGSSYTANVDGLMHFIANSLPDILGAIPQAKLLVAGSICRVLPPNLPGIELLGPVEDLSEAYARAGVVINPVLAGSGLKTKTVEALAFRRALVTTPCGAEGMEAGSGTAFHVARDDAEFSALTIGLLASRWAVAELATRGLNFVTDWNEAQINSLHVVLGAKEKHETIPHRPDFSPEPASEIRDVCRLAGQQSA